MSFFNHINSGGISALHAPGNKPRDPLTGRLLEDLTPRQLELVLERYPHLRAVAPTLPDPHAIPEWNATSWVNGTPVIDPSDARQVARWSPLLRDPVQQVRKSAPTKPTKPEPEPSLYRTASHEMAGHAFVAFALGIPVAQVSVIPDGKGNLGETRHADLPDTPESLAFLLAGETAEVVVCGQARTAGLGGDHVKARSVAERIVQKQGGNADALIEKARQRCLAMMRGEERALRRMAFELVRRKTLVFEEIEQVLSQAFEHADRGAVLDDAWRRKIARAQVQRDIRKLKEEQAAKGAPKQGRVVRTYDFSNQEDVRDWNRQMGHQDLDAEPIGFGVGHIVQGSYR